jgi:hypothetical protein
MTVACAGETENDDDTACEATVWYVDADADGFGVEEDAIEACSGAEGYSEASGDCDDAHAVIAPGVDEVCDDVDNNCDGHVDEDLALPFYADTDGDGHGDPAASVVACQPSDGYVDDDTDCDDGDATVYEGAAEVCDGIDNDCDDDVDAADPDVVATVWYADDDVDGYGDAGDTVTGCEQPDGYISVDSTDCDDGDASVHPGGIELCYDGVDNDCDKLDAEGCAVCGDLHLVTYFDSFSSGSSPVEYAAAVLGMSATATTTGSDFATGLAAGADVVVIDVPGLDLPIEVVDGIEELILAGSLVVFSWWDLGSDAAMQSTLGVSVRGNLNSPKPMYPTTAGTALWNAVDSVPDPMTGSDNASRNGQVSDAIDTKSSETLAVYEDDSTKPAILSVFDGTVIVNGYLPWDYWTTDGDADAVDDATELYVNELAWITNCAP